MLNIPFFKEKPEWCVASLLQEYIRRTTYLREKDSSKHRLLLTYTKKPPHEATSQSISRWIKDSLEESGINTTIFKAHSTRHASTSAAARGGTNIEVNLTSCTIL